MPATLLDTGDRNRDGPVCRGEDREIEDAILLGADQLLAIEQQHGTIPVVDEAKLRHRTRRGDLGHAGSPVGQGGIEQSIDRLGHAIGQEREQGQLTVLHRRSDGHAGQTFGDDGHRIVSLKYRGRRSALIARRCPGVPVQSLPTNSRLACSSNASSRR